MRPNQIPILLRSAPAAAVTGAPVQTTGNKHITASTNATETFVFPAPVTAGNTVVLCITTFEGGGTSPTGFTLGGTAAVKDATKQKTAGNYTLSIWRATNVAGGTANCVLTWDFDHSGSYFTCSAEEWSGFLASPVDQVPTAVGNIGVSSQSITSGATTQAKEVVYAAFSTSLSDFAALAGPTSGFTTTVLDNAGSNIPIAAGYKIVAATGTQAAGATCTLASDSFDGVMVTYKTT